MITIIIWAYLYTCVLQLYITHPLTHARTHTQKHTTTHTYTHTHTHRHTHTCTRRVCVCVYVCVHAYEYVPIHINKHVYIHMYIYVCTICTAIKIYILSLIISSNKCFTPIVQSSSVKSLFGSATALAKVFK